MPAHIYIGTVGLEGVIDLRGSGQADANRAKEHHAPWVEQELTEAGEAMVAPGAQATGAGRSGSPAGSGAAPAGPAA